MRKLALLALLLLAFAVTAVAQNVPKAEVFGGYSYLRVDTGISGADKVSLNGWNAALAGNLNRHFAIVADFSGHYGSPDVLGVQVKSNQYSFLFGPQISNRSGKIMPFAHALFGGSRARAEVAGVSSTDTAFAMALGGGVDAQVYQGIAIRIIQGDYLMTRFGDERQNNFRISAGVVLRFGGR